MVFQYGGRPGGFGNADDIRPASTVHRGLMPRLGAASATLGGFTITGTGNQQSINTSAATANVAGALVAADFSKLAALGSAISAVRGANLAVLAATATTLQGITLTVGNWLVTGWCSAQAGAAAQNVDVWLDQGQIGTAGSYIPATQAVSLFTPPAKVTVVAGTLVVNLKGYSPAAWTALWVSPAAGTGNAVGLMAVLIG